MKKLIEIKNIVKDFDGQRVLNGISLDIHENEFVTLLGPSGCGKTTLLRMIAGFNSIEGGDFYFGDKRINDVPAHKRDIGMVFQNYAIFPHLSVRDNVAYGLKARKVPAREIKPRVDEALELVQISHLADRKPNELSGGQQQRVAIARALAKNPKLLLCDEPTGALDYVTGKQILKLLQDTCQQKGVTVVVITHNSAITPMADRVIHIKNGTVESMQCNEHPTSVELIEW